VEKTMKMTNGVCVVSVEGDVDLYSAPDLHRSWLEHAARPGAPAWVLDLEKASYLDSSGIGVLMQILGDSRERNIPFRLCNVRGMIEKLLRLSRMNAVLPISRDLDEALIQAKR